MAMEQHAADIGSAAGDQVLQHPAHSQSIIQWVGEQETYTCGYCNLKRPGQRVVAGFVSQKLNVYAYQQLLDRGWRRSGTYFYLTYPDKSCCPAYTIRLHCPSFQPSAAQKKALRRFEKFLSGEWMPKQYTGEQQQTVCNATGHDNTSMKLPDASGGSNVHPHASSRRARSRFSFAASPPTQDQGKEQKKKGKGVSQSAVPDGVPKDEVLMGAAPTAETWRSAAKALAKRCNESVYAAAKEKDSPAPAALLNVLVDSSENVMFTVKWTSLDPESGKPAEVDTNSEQAVKYTPLCIVRLYSSVCWKAASKYLEITRSQSGENQVMAARVPDMQQATVAEQPAAPVSKKQAKKAEKLAAKASKQQATATVASTKGQERTVSSIAEEMGAAVLPVVEAALKRDEMLSALAPKAICVRGHIHITLRIPHSASLERGAAAELKDLFTAAGRSSHNSLPPAQGMDGVMHGRDAPLGGIGGLPQRGGTTKTKKRSQSGLEAGQSLAHRSTGNDVTNSRGASAGRGPRKEEEGQAAEAAASCDEDISSENDSEGGSSQGTDESHENARLHNSDQIGAQMRVDNDENSSQQSQWWLEAPPPGGRQFRTVMLPSQFIEQEYQLYRKYQIRVHSDKPSSVTRTQYKRFLIANPFDGVVSQSDDPDAPECGYGAFHQQWWIGDHLVAICVVDILPRCLSSKYFIWDPDLHFLSLGRVSALKEIEWVQHAHATGRGTSATTDINMSGDAGMGNICTRSGNPLQYTYLGLYIHSNQKMRYKAEYRTSELLCRSTLRWVPLTPQFLEQLDTNDGVLLLSVLHAPIDHQDPPIPPWSLPPAEGSGDASGTSTRSRKRDAASRSSNGMQDTQQPALHVGHANSSRTFTAGSIKALISNYTKLIDEWPQFLRSDVVPQLRDIADEFLEGVGPEVASISVMDL